MPGVLLTLAHSPDPDDVFMWWPLTGMIDPADRRTVVAPAEIDGERFQFVSVAEDIAVLNRLAAEGGEYDITAVSMFAWAQERVRARYALTSFGSSMGRGYGPKLVRRAGGAAEQDRSARLASPVCLADEVEGANRAAEARAREWDGSERMVVAVPGVKTTAFLLLSMMLGPETFEHVEMPFDQIADAVAAGRGGVNAGLLIHQSQLTCERMGLEVVADLGAWWLERTGLPLPLGGNALRRDLDARHGPGTTRDVARVLHRSIVHALEKRERSIEYAMKWAPELSRAEAERYIEMYVNNLTVDAGEEGRRAIWRLLDEGARLGLCPAPGTIDMVRPTPASDDDQG